MNKLILIFSLAIIALPAAAQDEIIKFSCVCALADCAKKDTFNIAYTKKEVIDGDTVTYWGFTPGRHYPINFDAFYAKNDTVYFLSNKYAYLFSPLFAMVKGEPVMLTETKFNNPIGDYNGKIYFDKMRGLITIGFAGAGFNFYSISFNTKGAIMGYLYYDGVNSWNCARLK